ncbi:hypothetical protein QQ045_024865 [Rhodiola kirilowii]
MDLCVIIEPMSSSGNITKLATQLKYENVLHCYPTNNHIWILWSNNIHLTEIKHSSQHITVDIQMVQEDVNVLCSFIYEKKGGNKKKGRAIREFNEFIVNAGVLDVGYKGSYFTWSNNQEGASQIWERLDRCLVNGLSLASFPNLEEMVKGSWAEQAPSQYCPKVKTPLRCAPKMELATFRRCYQKVQQLSVQVAQMEMNAQMRSEPVSRDEIHKVKSDLSYFLCYQYAILEEKSKHKGLLEGDQNLTVFHASIEAKRIQNRLRLHQEDGSYTKDADIIGNDSVRYFQNLFGDFPNTDTDMVTDVMQLRISSDQNSNLTRIPEEEEVKKVVFCTNPASSPGTDGFTGKFFHSCWDIIKEDLVSAIIGFFTGLQIPKLISYAHIDLLPKVKNVSSLDQPKDEGGLGLRLLSDVKKCLLSKLAWRFKQNNSIWATYARNKYFRSLYTSAIWTALKPYIHRLRRDSYWEIGKGDIQLQHFCEWLNVTLPKEAQDWLIKDVVLDSEIRGKFLNMLQEVTRGVIDSFHLSNRPDLLRWRGSDYGVFSTKACYERIRAPLPKSLMFKHLWHSWLPPKISTLIWRLWHKALPTDDNIPMLGFAMASKCRCCKKRKEEETEHMFIHSEVAAPIWKFLASLFDKSVPVTISQLQQDWFTNLQKSDFMSYLSLCLAACTLWEVWINRNSRMFDKPCTSTLTVFLQSAGPGRDTCSHASQ